MTLFARHCAVCYVWCGHERACDQLSFELHQGQAFSRVNIWEGFQTRKRSCPGKSGGRVFHGKEALWVNRGNTGGGARWWGWEKLGPVLIDWLKLSYTDKISNTHWRKISFQSVRVGFLWATDLLYKDLFNSYVLCTVLSVRIIMPTVFFRLFS